MFKKVVFIEKLRKFPKQKGDFEWLNYCDRNFFFFSPQKLELNSWYEIIYYQGTSEVFRLKSARLIGLAQSINQPTQNITQNQIFINQQQNIFLMASKDTIEIIDQDYKTRFFLPKFSKYVLYSCAGSCWEGKFCNNCEPLGSEIKELSELRSNDYLWENKANPIKLVHKKTWMVTNFLK